MNTELQKLIDSKEEINEEILYEICLKHKSIPRVERNWTELADYLDLDKTGEQLRSWCNGKQVRDGTLPPKVLYNNNLVGNTPEVTEQLNNLYKERVKTQDALNTYKNTLRDEARLDRFKEDIINVADGLGKLPLIKFDGKVNKNRSTEAVLLLSDLHIGVDCHNFYNTYNDTICKQRLMKLVANVIDYCKNNNVQTLNVVNLGDMIHGVIHTNARIDQQMDVITQTITAAEFIAETLNQLQKAAPNVVYRYCSDNHSRLVSNKHENIERENFGRIIHWFVKERLKNTKIKFAEDNLDFGLGKFTLSNGKVCVFAHGHEDNISQSFQNYVGATKEYVDYIFLGHYHNTKMKSFQGAKVFVNGSLVGTEEYALSKRLFSDPEQLLLIFDDNNTIIHNINLK